MIFPLPMPKDNPSKFSFAFRSVVGCTPREYKSNSEHLEHLKLFGVGTLLAVLMAGACMLAGEVTALNYAMIILAGIVVDVIRSMIGNVIRFKDGKIQEIKMPDA